MGKAIGCPNEGMTGWHSFVNMDNRQILNVFTVTTELRGLIADVGCLLNVEEGLKFELNCAAEVLPTIVPLSLHLRTTTQQPIPQPLPPAGLHHA